MFSVPAWFNSEPDRWSRELTDMQSFPQFAWGERSFPGNYRYWRGTLQPFGEDSNVELIARHLKLQRPLSVHHDGRLIPTEHNLTKAKKILCSPLLYTAFDIEIIYFEPPIIPRIYALSPRIDSRTFSIHPHLSRGRPHPLWQFDMVYPKDDLCVFATQDDAWLWEVHTVADLIEYTSFWLGAHLLWIIGGKKTWLIPEASHDPLKLLLSTPPQAQCSCGSGKHFVNCCAEFCINDLKTEKSVLDPPNLRFARY